MAAAVLRACRGFASGGASSARWQQQQRRDPYVRQARRRASSSSSSARPRAPAPAHAGAQAVRLGYRARSAFKLLQLHERFALLRPGMRVVDCGAAPGGWSQVAAGIVVPSAAAAAAAQAGCVVSVDLRPIHPIAGCTLLTPCDVTAPDAAACIVHALGGARAHVVLSDMAPNASGIALLDQDASMALARAVLRLCESVLLVPTGALVVKLLRGRDERAFRAEVQSLFATVREWEPPATRKHSAEYYVVAKGFRGPRAR